MYDQDRYEGQPTKILKGRQGMKKLFSALLAGAMLLAMGLSFAACGGQKAFYTLQEAYEREIISYEDLKQIHANQQVGSEPLYLTEEEDAAIRQSFFENSQEIVEYLNMGGLEYSSADEIEILTYEGCYHGYYAVRVKAYESPLTNVWTYKVEGLTFYRADGTYTLIWTNPEGIVFE